MQGTRETIGQTYCDGKAKLILPKLRKRTVVFETGEGVQLPLTKSLPLDWCAYARSTRPMLDVGTFLVRQVDVKPRSILTEMEVHEIGERCLSTVAEYAHKYESMHPFNSHVGRDLFRATIVSYDAKQRPDCTVHSLSA